MISDVPMVAIAPCLLRIEATQEEIWLSPSSALTACFFVGDSTSSSSCSACAFLRFPPDLRGVAFGAGVPVGVPGFPNCACNSRQQSLKIEFSLKGAYLAFLAHLLEMLAIERLAGYLLGDELL
jgi:hypothetical protein